MRDCPGKPSTTRTAVGPHSSGVAVVSSSGKARPARAHIRAKAASRATTAGPHTINIVSRQHGAPFVGLPAHSLPMHSPPDIARSPSTTRSLRWSRLNAAIRPLDQIGRNGRTSTPWLRSSRQYRLPVPWQANAGPRALGPRRGEAPPGVVVVNDVVLEMDRALCTGDHVQHRLKRITADRDVADDVAGDGPCSRRPIQRPRKRIHPPPPTPP